MSTDALADPVVLQQFVLELARDYPDHFPPSDVEQLLEFIDVNESFLVLEELCAFHVYKDIAPTSRFQVFVHDIVDSSGR